MNHVDEITALSFLEGELDRAQSITFEGHLSECPECRALLRVLQQESLLLSNALVEGDEPLPARLQTSPWHQLSNRSRGTTSWAHWAWLLGFVLTAAACFTAWTDVVQPWADQLNQTGIQASSLLIRFAMSGVFWEGWTNVLNTILEVVGVLIAATLGIIILVLLRGNWGKAAATAMTVAGVAVLLGSPASANAAEIRKSNDITVTSGETVKNDLIAMGETVRVDGTVDGDLIAFSQNVTITGHVTGDIIAFGDQVRVSGPVDGNVRCFCNTLILDGTVAKNLSAGAAHVELGPSASVNGGVIAAAGSFIADGKVTRDLLLFVGNTTLEGPIGGDVRLRGGQLSVGAMARIGGRLHVISDKQPDISSSAKLAHALEYEFVNGPQSRIEARRRRFVTLFSRMYFFRQMVSYGVAFLCGLLLIKLFPGVFAAVGQATHKVGLSLGVGALILIAGLPLFIFSIVLVIAGAWAGFAVLMLYAPLLYASQLFIGSWIGEAVLHKPATSHIAQFALGLLILRLAGMIPFLGFFVWSAVLMWGSGAILVALWNRTRLQPLPAPVA